MARFIYVSFRRISVPSTMMMGLRTSHREKNKSHRTRKALSSLIKSDQNLGKQTSSVEIYGLVLAKLMNTFGGGFKIGTAERTDERRHLREALSLLGPSGCRTQKRRYRKPRLMISRGAPAG